MLGFTEGHEDLTKFNQQKWGIQDDSRNLNNCDLPKEISGI